MDEDTRAWWGALIQGLRTEEGLSQRELAEAARVNRNTLRRIEAGTADMQVPTIERLLANLGYELEAIRPETGERARLTREVGYYREGRPPEKPSLQVLAAEAELELDVL